MIDLATPLLPQRLMNIEQPSCLPTFEGGKSQSHVYLNVPLCVYIVISFLEIVQIIYATSVSSSRRIAIMQLRSPIIGKGLFLVD